MMDYIRGKHQIQAIWPYLRESISGVSGLLFWFVFIKQYDKINYLLNETIHVEVS